MPPSSVEGARIIEFPGVRRAAIPSYRPTAAERRFKFRYPLDLSVRFRFSVAGSVISGDGLAVNVSSGGVLVACHHDVRVGALMELSIEWPLLLDGRTPLQLIAMCRVLRRGAHHFAAKFERYEFHTMKTSIQA
jgi:hypothetical protein